jgi:hypothetical protein
VVRRGRNSAARRARVVRFSATLGTVGVCWCSWGDRAQWSSEIAAELGLSQMQSSRLLSGLLSLLRAQVEPAERSPEKIRSGADWREWDRRMR